MEWIAVCRVNASNPLYIILKLELTRISVYLARKTTFPLYQMDEPMIENPQALATRSSSHAVVHRCESCAPRVRLSCRIPQLFVSSAEAYCTVLAPNCRLRLSRVACSCCWLVWLYWGLSENGDRHSSKSPLGKLTPL
jgi:hypothetical protein